MTPFTRRTLGTGAIAAAITLAAAAAPALAHADTDSDTGSATTAPVVAGLYQSAYSESNDALWVTSAVGKTAEKSSLVKLDPDTLEVQETYTPPTNPDTGALEAVYGIDVDDSHNTVWTTNTRNDSLAVYNQKTGKHLASVPNVAHAREVVVDEAHDTVWASGNSDGSIVAFDAKTYKEKDRITVDGSSPAGLTVNEKTGAVYATDLEGNQIIEISPDSKSPRLIPTGEGPISIALSANGRTAYTANQTAGTLSIVDLKKGKVTDSVTTGKGALSVDSDSDSGAVLVANRDAATVSVVDPKAAKVVENLTTEANPNHIGITDGDAYVVDKSGAGPDGVDQVTRFELDD